MNATLPDILLAVVYVIGFILAAAIIIRSAVSFLQTLFGF